MESLKTQFQEQRSSFYNVVLGVAFTFPVLAEDRSEFDALGAAGRIFDPVREIKAQLAAVSAAPVTRSAAITKAKLTAARDANPDFREMHHVLQFPLPPDGASRGGKDLSGARPRPWPPALINAWGVVPAGSCFTAVTALHRPVALGRAYRAGFPCRMRPGRFRW